MEYFKIIDLNKEPFSNSPDPNFFFKSNKHLECLQKLELSIRLKRGLNVVIGDVGTGKTTLCRKLIQEISSDDKIETHLILDPYFKSPIDFLNALSQMFWKNRKKNESNSEDFAKESIKQYLFQNGAEENKIVVLLIDEGQKIPVFCLEIIRELLNYETNEFKLLQIIIFAQKEFESTISEYKNFTDRINFYHLLEPLSFNETKEMIYFRLNTAGYSLNQRSLFTLPAIWVIYRATKGYPRRIVTLCHKIILTLIIQNFSKASWRIAKSCSKRASIKIERRPLLNFFWGMFIGILIIGSLWTFYNKNQLVVLNDVQITKPKIIEVTSFKTKEIKLQKNNGQDKIIKEEEQKPPNLIGEVKLKKGETLSWMALKLYGSTGKNIIDIVMEANPNIIHPNKVKAGESIKFPSIIIKENTSFEANPYIQISECSNLETAFFDLREKTKIFENLRILAYWVNKSEIKFSVVSFVIDAKQETSKKDIASFYNNDIIFLTAF
ncbi:MAG: AAA family ATPase [Desulfobacterales bacterium]|nr:AAA family ATPase [Desulfobacterales bacterium]